MRTRIKEATERKANYIFVVGDREAAARQVSVRRRGSRDEERGVALDTIVERLVAERDSKALPPDFARPEGAPTLMADA
jgi:threonyl-tRNA synthetase